MGEDNICVAIEKSVELDDNFPLFWERYLTPYYFIPLDPLKKKLLTSESCSQLSVNAENSMDDLKPTSEDTCVLLHTNDICVIALPPKHPVFTEKKEVTKVNFNVGGFDRLSNKATGKSKRGAQVLQEFSPLCSVECSDGKQYLVYAGARGKLMEVNTNLVTNPGLVKEYPFSEGYLAIINPLRLGDADITRKRLLTNEQYENLYRQ